MHTEFNSKLSIIIKLSKKVILNASVQAEKKGSYFVCLEHYGGIKGKSNVLAAYKYLGPRSMYQNCTAMGMKYTCVRFSRNHR